MRVQIVKPSDLKYVKALIFSPPGHGKTTLLGSAQLDERTSPMLLLDFEGGTESLAGLDIDVAPIKSWDDYNEIFEMLSSTDHGYKSIGIDSISETHIFALLDILRVEGPNRKDSELLEQRDYGKASVQMRRFLRSFRDLPLHVFFTAHAKEVEIPRQGRVQLPNLSGQMAEEAVGIMSVVGYLAETEEENEATGELETHRLLLLKNYPKFRVKARTPWGAEIPDDLLDPTVTTLLDILGYPAVNGDAHTDTSPVEKEEEVEEEQVEEEQDGPPPEDDPEEEETVDYSKLSVAQLKQIASDREIDLEGANTRKKIIEYLEAVDEDEQALVA